MSSPAAGGKFEHSSFWKKVSSSPCPGAYFHPAHSDCSINVCQMNNHSELEVRNSRDRTIKKYEGEWACVPLLAKTDSKKGLLEVSRKGLPHSYKKSWKAYFFPAGHEAACSPSCYWLFCSHSVS